MNIAALTLLFSLNARADGMVPDTSVVIVHESEGEASVSVTNTDSQLALLHVTLENIPEDTEPLFGGHSPAGARSTPANRNWCVSFCRRSSR